MTLETLIRGNTVLALFPSREGFGWIVCDGPLSPVDWEVCTLAGKSGTSNEKNARCIKKIEAILKAYQPAVVVLEAFEGSGTRRHERIKQLGRSIMSLSNMYHSAIRIVSREEVASYFARENPKTRHAVATVVALHLPEIRRLLPDKRKAWQTEFPYMALFAAAALLFVHYANPEERL